MLNYLSHDGPRDDVCVILIGVNAVHVLVEDGDLLLVVPTGRTGIRFKSINVVKRKEILNLILHENGIFLDDEGWCLEGEAVNAVD